MPQKVIAISSPALPAVHSLHIALSVVYFLLVKQNLPPLEERVSFFSPPPAQLVGL